MAESSTISRQIAKRNAKKMLEGRFSDERMRKRAEVYEEGLTESAKIALAGMGYPIDVLEGVSQGIFTPPASYKFSRMRPPTAEDFKIDPESGKPVYIGKGPAADPEFKGTYPYLAEKLGVKIDPHSSGAIAPSFLSPDPFSKIKALTILGKLGAGKLSSLASLFMMGGLAPKVVKNAERLKKAGKSSEAIAKKLGVIEDPATKSGWRALPEELPLQAYGGEKTMLSRSVQQKIMASDSLKDLRKFMTEEELLSLTPDTIKAMETIAKTGKTRTGKSVTILLGDKEIPRLGKEELGAMAFAGRFKKGWYRHGAKQLRKVFEDDTERFIALLAGMSPQTSVEMNLENALRTWNNWEKAGRPIEAVKIKKIMGQSVVGKGTEESVMEAWVNNSVTALSAKDPTKIRLSGPKADSFMQNLLDNLDEVTLDTWQGRAYNFIQDLFGGVERASTGRRGVKSPGYILSASATRRAAAYLEKKTGTKWKPAEIQETIWSFVKALYEKRKSPGGRATAMDELYLDLSPNEIANVPDFASLISTDKYGKLLQGEKYGRRIRSVEQFQSPAEAYAASTYRGFESSIERSVKGLEQQFRTTETTRIVKTIRDKVHRGIISDRSGTGRVNRTFTSVSARNPGGELTGLGKLTGYNLSKADKGRLNSLGISTPVFYELPQTSEAGAIFQKSIENSKVNNKFGSAVYVYGAEEYSTFRNFLTKDGKTGFSVKPDGDIVSVFNTKGSGRKASTVPMLLLAVEKGGNKLDAFDTMLPQLYSRIGFRPSSRTVWNDEFAPPDWDKNLFKNFNKGEPDVMFMHYDPDSKEIFEALSGPYDPDDVIRNSLLRDEFDDAVGLQTLSVEEAQQRYEKVRRLPGEKAERMGHAIPKAPWKVKERGLVPTLQAKSDAQAILAQ